MLSLVGNVINMYEYPDDTFEYPAYKNYSNDFAREIQRTIENSNYYSVNLYLNVIENVRSPLIRMLLAGFLHTKITGHSKKSSLSIPFNAIYKQEIDSFDDKLSKKNPKNSEQYPIYDPKRKLKRCVIVQEDFLRHLLLYAESVNSFYQISAAYNAIQKTEVAPVLSSTILCTNFKPFDEKNILRSIKSVDLSEEVNLRKIDLNFKKMVHIRLTQETCSFYRDEIKHLLLLIKLIKRCAENNENKFDNWMKFIHKIEAEN